MNRKTYLELLNISGEISRCKKALAELTSVVSELDKSVAIMLAQCSDETDKKDSLPNIPYSPPPTVGDPTFPNVVTVYGCPSVYPVNSPYIFETYTSSNSSTTFNSNTSIGDENEKI